MCVKHEKIPVHFNISLIELFLFVIVEIFFLMINDKHKLLQRPVSAVKANDFSRFSHSNPPCNICLSQLYRWMSISWRVFLPISFMSIMAPFLQLHIIRYKVLRNTNIQNEKKIHQIESSFCHANAVKLLFISVQLDSGQFQENSQEYLR